MITKTYDRYIRLSPPPPHNNLKSFILGQITDETDHSAHVQSDAEQRNNITNSAILKLYSAVTHFFSLPNACAIMYFDIGDAHSIHTITTVPTVETQK